MNKQTKIGLIAGIVGFMILMVWLFTSSDEKPSGANNERQPYVSANWTKKFQLYDKNPLGLYLFSTLTRAHLEKDRHVVEINDWTIFDMLISDSDSNKTYMFVGNNFGLKNSEVDTLVSRVLGGSDLFLSFNDLTENLYEALFEGFEFQFDYTESVNVFAGKNKYKMINLFQTDTVACEWRAFGSIDENISYESLSSFMEMSNFVKVKLGEGNLFLHTTPNMFYNYQIKRLPGYKYTEFVLNELPTDRDIYMLEFGRLSDNYGNYDVDDEDGPGEKEDDSYLKLIFQNPTLLTALLLSILGVILFVMFRSKRTRPIVPFIEPKKDMTLAFAETITSIYFAKRNPYGLLQVQRKNFYSTIQKHFFVDLQRREGDRALQVLAEKSNQRFEEIKNLLARLETKEAFSVNDMYVTEMQKKIHAFYRITGLISNDLSEKIMEREMVFKRSLFPPAFLIGGGIAAILEGLYLLTDSVGVGIALWPAGIALLFLGVKRITKPYLRITKDTIYFYTSLGREKTFKKADLISTDLRRCGAIFYFRNNKNLIINYWDMSRFDKKQFEQFLSKINTLEL